MHDFFLTVYTSSVFVLLIQIRPLLPKQLHVLLDHLSLHHRLMTLIHRIGRAAKIKLLPRQLLFIHTKPRPRMQSQANIHKHDQM